MKLWPVVLLFVASVCATAACAQLQLPEVDGSGEILALQATVDHTLRHQQQVIATLLGLLALSFVALFWLSLQWLRLQDAQERIAEAIRRVDLLSEAFRSVNAGWSRRLRPDEARPEQTVVDLDTVESGHNGRHIA